ncbi:unnamed protein product, partial [Rotaria magnacalcarata]
MSDSLHLRQIALERWRLPHVCLETSNFPCEASRYSFNLITTTEPPQHICYSKKPYEALQVAMLETFLFSLCDEHIISHGGFGRLAAFASLNQRTIYNFHNGLHQSCLHAELEDTFV